jgi:polysaccharide export outer membrane protein
VRRSLSRERRIPLLAVCALQWAMMEAPGLTQVAGTQSTSQMPAQVGAGTSGSSAKFGSAGKGMAPVVLPADFADLRIEAGDLLSVSVFDAPEYNEAYRVDASGDLMLPLCGKIRVQGLTSSEAGKLIEETYLHAQILNQPQVTVDVQQYAGHYVTVLGEVANPGRITVIAPTKLSDILAEVGGLTVIAGPRIRIRRGADAQAREEEIFYSRSDSNPHTGAIDVRPGDTVVVPRTGIVYVLGGVYHPGGYIMQEDGTLNVAEALALSGGTVLTAKTNGLRVVRRNKDGSIVDYALSYDGIAKGAQSPLELRAQDIVYVPMSKLKSAFTDATGIISAAASASIYLAR